MGIRLIPRLYPAAAAILALCGAVAHAADPYAGLWVGEAKLRYVSEVSVPLNSNNVAIAPNPNVPTPTSDEASIRLILHVNGAGQVSLLRDVAVLNRSGSNSTTRSENDLALVTDERLYSSFPQQPAYRIASSVFDFGDSKATDILNAIIQAAANAVTNSVATNTANLNNTTTRLAAEAAARQQALATSSVIQASVDVASAFDAFITGNFSSSTVDSVAGASDPAAAAQSARAAAVTLLNKSPYRDSRALDMVDAVLAALTGVTNGAARTNIAHNTAASYADVTNTYQRFVSGKLFGDMIYAAADAAARTATNPAATAVQIRAAIDNNPIVNDARTESIRLKIPQYRDTRGSGAIEAVLSSIHSAATNFLGTSTRFYSEIDAAGNAAGLAALSTVVAKYNVSAQAPTVDYNAFVRSAQFQTTAVAAAQAAAVGAVAEKKNNQLWTADSLRNAARESAFNALRDVFAMAARAVRTELPMIGSFGVGRGDPRLRWNIKQQNLAALGPAALTGLIDLPATHPTNPFRHRRHPDHAIGFDIRRELRLDFDATSSAPARAGYGVDRITGTYREAIHGLHKPLGPDPENNPIGLLVEGTFELSRISSIDTLNAR